MEADEAGADEVTVHALVVANAMLHAEYVHLFVCIRIFV